MTIPPSIGAKYYRRWFWLMTNISGGYLGETSQWIISGQISIECWELLGSTAVNSLEVQLWVAHLILHHWTPYDVQVLSCCYKILFTIIPNTTHGQSGPRILSTHVIHLHPPTSAPSFALCFRALQFNSPIMEMRSATLTGPILNDSASLMTIDNGFGIHLTPTIPTDGFAAGIENWSDSNSAPIHTTGTLDWISNLIQYLYRHHRHMVREQ